MKQIFIKSNLVLLSCLLFGCANAPTRYNVELITLTGYRTSYILTNPMASKHKDYTSNIYKNTTYTYPNAILSIRIGYEYVLSNEDYTYKEGYIYIPGKFVTGDIEITIDPSDPPIPPVPPEPHVYENIVKYTLEQDGRGYEAREGYDCGDELTIASTYNDLPVNEIGVAGFKNNNDITSIVPSTNIEVINSAAFSNCYSLSEIDLSNSKLTTIGDYAFNNDIDLLILKLPATLTSIGKYAFNHAENLKEITYLGTMEQWANVTLDEGYKDYCPLMTVHCSNGDITLP